MTRDTAAERSFRRRSTPRLRLGALLACCALLLAAAGCSDDDSVFDHQPRRLANSAPRAGCLGGRLPPGQRLRRRRLREGARRASATAIPASAQVYARLRPRLPSPDSNAPGRGPSGRSTPPTLTEGLDLRRRGRRGRRGRRSKPRTPWTCLGRRASASTPATCPPGWATKPPSALFDIQFDAATGEMTDPNILVAVDVADQAAAGGLPARRSSPRWEPAPGPPSRRPPTRGSPSHRADPGEWWRSRSPSPSPRATCSYGLGAGMVEQAIDLGDGASLADDPDFTEVLAALPDGPPPHRLHGHGACSSRCWGPSPARWPSRASRPAAARGPRPDRRRWPGPCAAWAWPPPCSERASASRWWPWASPARRLPVGDTARQQPARPAARRRHRLRRHRRLRRPRRLGLPSWRCWRRCPSRKASRASRTASPCSASCSASTSRRTSSVNSPAKSASACCRPPSAAWSTGSGVNLGLIAVMGVRGPGRHGRHRDRPGRGPRPA